MVPDTKHYDLVKQYVAGMYSQQQRENDRRGHISSSGSLSKACGNKTTSNGIVGVQLGNTAIFEDPVGVCRGPEEINEAFRALRYLEPVSITSPKCIRVEPQGETIRLTFFLHQQYSLPIVGSIPLRSILQVTVQLQQMKEIPESEFMIIKMKELWLGKPFAWPYPLYYPSRRLNGLLSYWLTSRFL